MEHHARGLCLSWIWLLLAALPLTAAVGVDQTVPHLPAGYELGEDTLSPDGSMGLLYPSAEGDSENYPPNLLVRFEPYRVLAEIEPGLPQHATADLRARWDGNAIVALYQFRKWGLTSLTVYEIEKGRVLRREDVFNAARKFFQDDIRKRLLKKYPAEAETIIFVSSEGEENPATEFTFEGRKLLLSLFADNKPNLAGGPHWTAKLNATWDIDAGKFIKVDFKPDPIEIRADP